MTTEHEENLGPAMTALTPLQRAWVRALVDTGGNATKAAGEAGYGADAATPAQKQNACAVAGYANARNPKVQDAIREEAGHRLYSGALIGASVLIEIASDPQHKDRLKAATKLLDHNGYQIIAQQEIKVTHTPDNRETVAKIVEFAQKMGLDPKQLLGQYGVTIDADFKVVDTGVKQLAAPAPTAAGLEDIL